MAYNSQFRKQATTGIPTPRYELNLSPMAATVFSAGGKVPTWACQLYFATPHMARNCALASLEVCRPPKVFIHNPSSWLAKAVPGT